MPSNNSRQKSQPGEVVPARDTPGNEQTAAERRAATRRRNLAAQEQADRDLVAETDGHQRPSKIKARAEAPWLANSSSRKRTLSSAAEPAAPKKAKSAQSEPNTNQQLPKGITAKTTASKRPVQASDRKSALRGVAVAGGNRQTEKSVINARDQDLDQNLNSDGESNDDGVRPIDIDDEVLSTESPESEELGSDAEVVGQQLDFERPVWTNTAKISRRPRRQVLSDDDDDDNAIMAGPFTASGYSSRRSVSSDAVSLPPETDYASSDMGRGFDFDDDEAAQDTAPTQAARDRSRGCQPSKPLAPPVRTAANASSSRPTKEGTQNLAVTKSGPSLKKSVVSVPHGTSNAKWSAARSSASSSRPLGHNGSRTQPSKAALQQQQQRQHSSIHDPKSNHQSQQSRSGESRQFRGATTTTDAQRHVNARNATGASNPNKQKTQRELAHEAEKPLWKSQLAPKDDSGSKPKPKTKLAALAKAPVVTHSAEAENEDDDDGAAASMDTNESYGKTARIVYPTYGGLKLMAQHPVLQDVIRGAHFKIAVDSIFENAYPTIISRPTFTRPILISVAREKKATEIKQRAKEDLSFSKVFAPMVVQRLNNQREALSKTGIIAADKYGIRSKATRAERLALVESLLDQYDRFIFPVDAQGNPMWHLPFNHESILTVIETSYFKNTGSFGQKHIHLFKSSLPADKYPKESKQAELPKPMIAVSATAVYAGIVAWESGERVLTLTFTAKRFEDKYRDLIRLLEDLEKRNALEYHQLVHKMFLKVIGQQQASVKPSAALSMIRLQAVDDADVGGEGSVNSDDGNEAGDGADELDEEIPGGEEDVHDEGIVNQDEHDGSDGEEDFGGEQHMFVGGEDGGFEEDMYEHEVHGGHGGEDGLFEDVGGEFEGEEAI